MANHTGTMKNKQLIIQENGQTRILQSPSLVSMGKCVIWMYLVSIVRDVKVFGSKTGWDVQCTMMRTWEWGIFANSCVFTFRSQEHPTNTMLK